MGIYLGPAQRCCKQMDLVRLPLPDGDMVDVCIECRYVFNERALYRKRGKEG